MSALKCNCRKFKSGESMPSNEQYPLTVMKPIAGPDGKPIERFKCVLCRKVYTRKSYQKIRRT